MQTNAGRAPSRAADRGDATGPIVVLYYANRAPLRASVEDHLYSIARYAGRDCVYINLAVRRLPSWLHELRPSAVIFHTILLAQRWHPPTFRRLTRTLQPLRRLACPKLALPQDDYIHTTALGHFIREFGVDHVFSCAPESEWSTIYGDLVEGPTKFTRVMPGYLEPATLARIDRIAASAPPRTIDIGYRAWRPDFSLGRHALLKARVGEVVAARSKGTGLRTDISLRDEDTLFGDDWYRFMLRCRWMIGVEGGASVLDPDGSIMERTAEYVRTHPNATFEEVEAACFPGRDGSVHLVSISPRHLEACATRTAQILVEGSYNDALEPGRHFIPLAADFSNVDEVLAQVGDEALRTRVASDAYEHVVASGRYEYRAFVGEIVHAIDESTRRRARGPRRAARMVLAWERRLDGPSWVLVRARTRLRAVVARLGLLELVLRLRGRG